MSRSAVLGLLLLGVGCGGTDPAAQLFELRRLRDAPLPYVDTLGCCTYTAGSLRLDGNGYEARIQFLNPPGLTTFEALEQGRFLRRDDTVVFTPHTANLPLSLGPGVLQHDSLRLRLGGDSVGAADQFDALFIR